MKTGQTRTGAGIAATDGVVLANVTGLFATSDELVHDKPLAPSGGQATFTFKVTAPASGTAIKLWAVGLAANGSGTGGDKAAQITKDITVTGGSTTPPPDAGTPVNDAGTGPGSSSSGGVSDAGGTGAPTKPGSTSGRDASTSDNDADEDDEEGSGRRSSVPAETAACAFGGRAVEAGVFPILMLAGAAAVARRRRRRSGP